VRVTYRGRGPESAGNRRVRLRQFRTSLRGLTHTVATARRAGSHGASSGREGRNARRHQPAGLECASRHRSASASASPRLEAAARPAPADAAAETVTTPSCEASAPMPSPTSGIGTSTISGPNRSRFASVSAGPFGDTCRPPASRRWCGARRCSSSPIAASSSTRAFSIAARVDLALEYPARLGSGRAAVGWRGGARSRFCGRSAGGEAGRDACKATTRAGSSARRCASARRETSAPCTRTTCGPQRWSRRRLCGRSPPTLTGPRGGRRVQGARALRRLCVRWPVT
jgi:hypothetical protein